MDDFNQSKKVASLDNEAFDQYSEYDENYDDSYNDDYLDERIEYIIDEIEDIKSMLENAKKAKEEYTFNAEIEKLRAELLKTQNSQNMYFEVEKVKNDLTKENKAREEQLNREIASLRRALRTGEDGNSVGLSADEILSEFDKVNERLNNLSGAAATVVDTGINSDILAKIESLSADITAIKDQLAGIEFAPVEEFEQPVESADTADNVSYDMLAEIIALKEALQNNSILENEIITEINNLKQKISNLPVSDESEELSQSDDEETAEPISDDKILNEIIILREEIAAFKSDMNIEENSYQTGNNVDILNEILLLREDLSNLQSAEPKQKSEGAEAVDVDDLMYEQDQIDRHSVVLSELGKIKENFNDVTLLREEIQALKADIDAKAAIMPMQASTSETDPTAVYALAGLINSLKEEINDLKTQLAAKEAPVAANNDAAISELRELTVLLKSEVNSLRRDIAQHFEKDSDTAAEDSLIILDELSVIQKDIKSIKDEPDAAVLNEVLSLRESFQNMKQDLRLVDNTAAVLGGINALKESIDSGDNELMNEISVVRQDVAAFASGGALNQTLLDELQSLRQEVTAKQETERASMMFLSELTQSKLLSEKEPPQKEIAATSDNEVTGLSDLRNELAELAAMISSQKTVIGEDGGKRGRGRHKKDAESEEFVKDEEKEDGTLV